MPADDPRALPYAPPFGSVAEADVSPPPPPPRYRLAGLHVLLAEDGAEHRRLIEAYLRRAGALVVVAENGRVAVDRALAARAEGQPFDVVLMDLRMPELDGLGATTLLRACGYEGLVVALTAHAKVDDVARSYAAGCDDHLTKPVQAPDRLIDGVLRATARRRARVG